MKARIDDLVDDVLLSLAEFSHFLMFKLDKRLWLLIDLVQFLFLLLMAILLPQGAVLWYISGIALGVGIMATLATMRDQRRAD